MGVELRSIGLDLIDDHPRNPRVCFREDVIEAIAAGLVDGFSDKHAVHVRPVGDRFELISGHHRKRAALKVGLEAIPCWVEELDDEAAFMEAAWLGKAGHGRAGHGKARMFLMARRGGAGLGEAWHGGARRGMAWRGCF